MKCEKGIYTVFTAVVLVALLYLLGLAIDSGKLEIDRTLLQRASDAASVVGGSRIGVISSTEVEELSSLVALDNFESVNGQGSAREVVSEVINSNEVSVKISSTFDTFFSGKVVRGNSNWNLSRTSSAIKRPVAVVLVLDVSGSMTETAKGDYNCDEVCGPESRLQVLKRAAKAFVEEFDQEKDAFSVVTFSDFSEVVYPISTPFSQDDINSRIDSLSAKGWTNTHSGLVQARSQLHQLSEVTRGADAFKKVIVLITDGAPNRNSASAGNYPEGCPSSDHRPDLVWPVIEADLARREGVTIFGVGIGQEDLKTDSSFQTLPTDTTPGMYLLKSFMFRRLVNAPVFTDPDFPEECFGSYEQISDFARGQYLQSPDDYQVSEMLSQVSLSIRMKLTE